MKQVTRAVVLLALLVHGAVAQPQQRIKHVVLLMQENRSFDHLLGFLKRENRDIDGVLGNEWNPVNVSDPASPRVYVTADSAYITDPDPGHGVGDVLEQFNGGLMNGYVQNYERAHRGNGKDVMSCFDPDALPVSSMLARQFAIVDKWYCSVPGPTMPNRYYVHSATSYGYAENDVLPIILGFPQKTIFRSLEEAGLDWAVYFGELPTPLAFKDTRKVGVRDRVFHMSKFAEHVAAGQLPAFTHIDPRYGHIGVLPPNDDHPDHDVSLGQQLMKDVYEALRASPIWEETLLIITYDEHGGFYDHAVLPTEGIPNPDGLVSESPALAFDYLGPRVPTILVSPWIEKGVVVHDPPEAQRPQPTSKYDHASVPATLKRLFNLGSFLTRRDEWAGTFEHVLNRTTPRTDTPLTLPNPIPLGHRKVLTGFEPASGLQRELVSIAASLIGSTENGANMNKRQASRFIQRCVNKFFNKQMYPPEEAPPADENEV